MISAKTIQLFLRSEQLYKGAIDGNLGPKSFEAMRSVLAENNVRTAGWNDHRVYVAVQQLMFVTAGINAQEVGPIDGFVGPQFAMAFEHWQDFQRIAPMWTDDSHLSKRWPLQSDVEKVFGPPGVNLVTVRLPRPMRLAWDLGTVVRSVQLHRDVAESATAALEAETKVFNQSDWERFGLNLHGGTFNIRKMKGNSSKLSMHSYGIAWDRDPTNNAYRMTSNTARFARATYEPFWACWEAQGWVSLGRMRDIDWMHQQAARLA